MKFWPFKSKIQTPMPQVKAPRRARAPRVRSIDSGMVSRLTADWTTAPVHIDQIIYTHLRTLVARSRDRFFNDDYGRRFVNLVKTNVIGPQGFGLQSQATGIDGEADTPARVAIEAAFKDYKKKSQCDVAERLPFLDITNLVMQSLIVDGEALIRYHRGGLMACKWRLSTASVWIF